jgi:hypothetical protein
MSYPNPILGHNLIAADNISYRNLYKILTGGTLIKKIYEECPKN